MISGEAIRVIKSFSMIRAGVVNKIMDEWLAASLGVP
jgi:hypothetical protein